jgi:hypothetical protein
MLYALLIYEKANDFARRDSSVESEAYAGAWRAYHRALLDAGIFVSGKPLDVPETATTVRLRENRRDIQDGPYSNTKEQFGRVYAARAAFARCGTGMGGKMSGRFLRRRGSAADSRRNGATRHSCKLELMSRHTARSKR